jgi:hypothetical protein
MVKKDLVVSAVLLSLAIGSSDLLSMPKYPNADLEKISRVQFFSAPSGRRANRSSGRSPGVQPPATPSALGANEDEDFKRAILMSLGELMPLKEDEQRELDDALEQSIKTEKKGIAIKREKMEKVQLALRRGLLLFDTAGNGLCGFYAMQALHHAPVPVISISMEEVKECTGKISTAILRQVSKSEKEHADDDRVKVLETVLRGEDKYKEYIVDDSVVWNQFCADLAKGSFWLDYALLPFAYEVFGHRFDCVDCNNPQALREISIYGGLINYNDNHFMLAIPEDLPNGGKRVGVRCQDFNGRWWVSKPGEPAVPEEFLSQEESLLFSETLSEEPAIPGEKDSVSEKD